MTATASVSIAETPTQPANSVNGNTRFFHNQTYYFEALRALTQAPTGGADVNEVLEMLKLITEGVTPPCGAPLSLVVSSPSSITRASSHCLTSFKTRRSEILRATSDRHTE